MPDRINRIKEDFSELFGTSPAVIVKGPGRVDLMGSHTDYNDGFILTMTIDRDTWIAARPRDDGRIRLHSLNVQGGGEFDLAQIEFNRRARWTNYMAGVVKIVQAAGYTVRGFDALVDTTLPVASGPSSSAALEMAAEELSPLATGTVVWTSASKPRTV